MNFIQLLLLGFKNYVKGVKFLITHNLYWFAIFPIVIFIGVYWLGWYFEALEYSVLNDISTNGKDIDSLNGLVGMTGKMVFLDSLYIVFTKLTMYIVVVLLSPILSIISEKIEEIKTGNKYPFNLKQLMHDVKRGMQIAMRNILWEYLFFIVILGIAAFFGGGAKKVIIFSIPIIIGFYYYGFAFMDYINERRRLNIQQSTYFVSKHKGLAIAIGSVYSILFLSYKWVSQEYSHLPSDNGTQILWGTILIITLFLAAIAPILAITSATLSMHELLDLGKNEFAVKKEVLSGDQKENKELETDTPKKIDHKEDTESDTNNENDNSN